jgi:hypothetical protein
MTDHPFENEGQGAIAWLVGAWLILGCAGLFILVALLRWILA